MPQAGELLARGATVGLTDPVQGPLPSAGPLRVGGRAGGWLEGGQSSVRGLKACLGLGLGLALIPGGGLPEAPLPRRNTHTSGNYKSKQGSTQSLRNLSKVAQLLSDQARVQKQAIRLQTHAPTASL